MKVVINACFGGFNLSTEATKKLIAENASCIRVIPLDTYTGGRPSLTFTKFMRDVGDGFMIGFIEDVLLKDGMVYTTDYSYSGRNDPVLVRVVEELGEKASGMCSKLKVVEIPDGVDWEIEEYDGFEHIAEKHRTWE